MTALTTRAKDGLDIFTSYELLDKSRCQHEYWNRSVLYYIKNGLHHSYDDTTNLIELPMLNMEREFVQDQEYQEENPDEYSDDGNATEDIAHPIQVSAPAIDEPASAIDEPASAVADFSEAGPFDPAKQAKIAASAFQKQTETRHAVLLAHHS